MPFYRLFTHKADMLDIKSNRFICRVCSSARRLFTMICPVSGIHHAQTGTAAKPRGPSAASAPVVPHS